MTEHEELIRSLLVERFWPYTASEVPASTPQQVTRAMAHERRRPAAAAPRRRRRPSDTIDDTRRTP